MNRNPVVAGQFYPGSGPMLEREVRGYLAAAPPRQARHTILAMVPHAGYVYSGPVAGLTLGQANLAGTVLLLGPNHTGRGAALAVWPTGRWLTPLCALDVDEPLAKALLATNAGLAESPAAHDQEHSLEVLVPFLCALNPHCTAVPVTVSEARPAQLATAARAIAAVLKTWTEPVSILVSSDMSHYVSQEQAKRLDAMALEAILRLDPAGLYSTVRQANISMCGVLPMTLGLMIALELGATQADLAAYSTSGEASGDYDRVVGYAGVLVS